MNRYFNIQSTIITLLLIPSAYAVADIAPDPMTAGKALQQFDGEVTEVRMVDEDVLVRVFKNEILTVAEFSMYNEGETETIEVGFPYSYEGEFIEFQVFMNGMEVEARDGKKENVGIKKVTVFWKLWNMTFEQGKSYDIRVEYKTRTYEMEHTFLWTDSYISMPASEIEKAVKLTKSGSVSYWLDTGKAWKGVLDRCRIEFELVDKLDDNIRSWWPGDGSFTGSGMVWEYADYEPTGRITMRYYPNMVVEDIPPYLLDLLKQYPNDPHLASSVGTTLRSDFDKKDLALAVYHSFLASWDGHIPQLMEYASGGRCRYNIRGAGGSFYMTWRMAKLLFDQYEKQGTLDKVIDVAPAVSKICNAIADSLDTCGNLPESNVRIYTDAIELLDRSNSILEAERLPAGAAK